MSFASKLKRKMAKAQKEQFLKAKKTIIDLGSAIAKSTPVDKGIAINNWNTSIGQYDSSTNNSVDKTGAKSKASLLQNVSRWDLTKSIFITNSLPYIMTLEYGGFPNPPKTGDKTINGYSKKAPNGMIRINVEKFRGLL